MTPDDTRVFMQMAAVSVTCLGALAGIGIAIHAYIQAARKAALELTRDLNHRVSGDDPRMLRLEQAVDSIAVEVERISEGQRFLTKLQTERTEQRLPGQ